MEYQITENKPTENIRELTTRLSNILLAYRYVQGVKIFSSICPE
jgi:hypothetical protein